MELIYSGQSKTNVIEKDIRQAVSHCAVHGGVVRLQDQAHQYIEATCKKQHFLLFFRQGHSEPEHIALGTFASDEVIGFFCDYLSYGERWRKEPNWEQNTGLRFPYLMAMGYTLFILLLIWWFFFLRAMGAGNGGDVLDFLQK